VAKVDAFFALANFILSFLKLFLFLLGLTYLCCKELFNTFYVNPSLKGEAKVRRFLSFANPDSLLFFFYHPLPYLSMTYFLNSSN
jgi:hypothetical protein